MKHIDKLVKFSNNELDFQKELLNVKSDIKNSKNQYREVNLLIKNVDRYCKTRLKDNYNKDDNLYLLEADDFCMFILNRLLNKAQSRFEVHKEVVLELLRVKTLSPDIKKRLNEELVKEVFGIIDICFTQGTEYAFKNIENKKVVEIISSLVQNMNTEILFKVSGLNPIIFVAEEGNKEANITKLGILLLVIDKKQLNADFDSYLFDLYGSIINQLVESSMTILMDDILIDSDTEYLMNKYSIKKDDLKITIGKDIALYLSKNTNDYSSLLDDVIKLSYEGRDMEKELEKHMLNMSFNLKNIF